MLLVLATVGFLAYDAVATPATGPEIAVHVDSIVARRANFVVHFTARNLGGSTGENVRIAGELRASARASGIDAVDTADSVRATERKIVVIHFIPPRSTRSGGLFFAHDPRVFRLTVRAEGFSSP